MSKFTSTCQFRWWWGRTHFVLHCCCYSAAGWILRPINLKRSPNPLNPPPVRGPLMPIPLLLLFLQVICCCVAQTQCNLNELTFYEGFSPWSDRSESIQFRHVLIWVGEREKPSNPVFTLLFEQSSLTIRWWIDASPGWWMLKSDGVQVRWRCGLNFKSQTTVSPFIIILSLLIGLCNGRVIYAWNCTVSQSIGNSWNNYHYELDWILKEISERICSWRLLMTRWMHCTGDMLRWDRPGQNATTGTVISDSCNSLPYQRDFMLITLWHCNGPPSALELSKKTSTT